ncbi:MAG: stage II sporulation protein M [Candidatus Hydrothermarchaeales archaeon]
MTSRKIVILVDVLKIWVVGIFLGIALSYLAPAPYYSGVVISTLDTISGAMPLRAPMAKIFFKNSLASLTVIFLGLLLSILELRVYMGVSPTTYAFLERLTDPLYGILRRLFPKFSELEPFFRSCFLYLYFIPVLAMIVNGTAFGFLFGGYLLKGLSALFFASMYPHAFVEIPAMLASAIIAFFIADALKDPISEGDLAALQNKIENAMRDKNILLPTLTIQALLLIAAFLETH